jgi:hypothetical protein
MNVSVDTIRNNIKEAGYDSWDDFTTHAVNHKVVKIEKGFVCEEVYDITVERDVPIFMQSVQMQTENGTGNEDTRFVQCQMQFTLKGYLYGPLSNASIILKAVTNMYDADLENGQTTLTMAVGGVGNYNEEDEVYSGASYWNSNWTARVLSWDPILRLLKVYSVKGRLPQQSDIVTGLTTSAKWTVTSTNKDYVKLVHMETTPTPNTVNVGNTAWIANTVITEFPLA